MKYYEKLLKLGCFSRKDIIDLTGNKYTAGSLIREYMTRGYIKRIRRDLYATISLETKQSVVSPYRIANQLFPDAVVSHHSAFEVYGYTNQVFYTLYVSTKNRFEDFTFEGIIYHRLLPKKDMHITEKNGIEVTSIEQTVIDSIEDYEKISGIEEVLRSIIMVPSLDENNLLDILKSRNVGFLWQKCGYILSQLNDNFNLSDKFFTECLKYKTGSRRSLIKSSSYIQRWDKEWGLYVPISLGSILNKGMYAYGPPFDA